MQKTKTVLFALPLVIVGGLLVLLYQGLGRDHKDLSSPLIGKAAPDFALPSLEHPTRTITNKDFAGAPYVLNVWGTWCYACREEHPTLLAIAARNEVPIVGLNWKDDSEAAREWLRRAGNPYAVTLVDTEGNVAIDWGVYGAPETLLVDSSGVILHKRIYPITMEIWEREFLPLIRSDLQRTGQLKRQQ